MWKIYEAVQRRTTSTVSVTGRETQGTGTASFLCLLHRGDILRVRQEERFEKEGSGRWHLAA